jgi:DNA transformation protein
MATSQNTIDFLLDQLREVARVRATKMFGEYALYCDGKVVALVCDDQLFVKITEAGKALVGRRYAEGFAYPGAKASMLIGAEDLEDSDRLSELIRVTAAALPAPKPKTPKASKKPRSPGRPERRVRGRAAHRGE